MTDESQVLDELGPVDWIVVEFPGSKFNGEIAAHVQQLVEQDVVRVLDVLILKKDDDGSIEAFEVSDLDDSEAGVFRAYEDALAHLLSEDDVVSLEAAMDPGTTAAVLVWENRWAAPFASAVRHAGGQLVANGRIPIQALIAAVAAESEEGD
jgi:hypothetical protein